MPADLTNPIFTSEAKARAHLEGLRWAKGRFCPHCGAAEDTALVRGRKHRPGLYYCNSCQKQFTVTVGTVFERSHVPLHKWLFATHLMAASKKGVSARQLHRMLGVTYKTAWFMAHRIREAMKDVDPTPMGGDGLVVEADEAYWGTQKKPRKNKAGASHKMKIFALVQRRGVARAFHMKDFTASKVRRILVTNLRRDSVLSTDESHLYTQVGKEFEAHFRVNHAADQYRVGDAYTNTIEGYFSIFKRGMTGVYQHCGEQHLQRYLNEFSFRYSNRKAEDAMRAAKALKSIEGKRLTYRRID